MTDTCELCDMRPLLDKVLRALDQVYGIARIEAKEIDDHIKAAYNHLETAEFLLEGHYCTVPKWDGPDTVRESEL